MEWIIYVLLGLVGLIIILITFWLIRLSWRVKILFKIVEDFEGIINSIRSDCRQWIAIFYNDLEKLKEENKKDE